MIETSLRPRPRPAKLDTTVAVEQTPVTRNATTTAQFDPTQPMLLGIFGKEDNPHALIRLPSGQVRDVAKGDRIGAQRIAAIAPDAVILANAQRLRLP